MKKLSASPEEAGQSMSAMTDVVFLLLIFFLVTMSGYVEMTLLETGLPGDGSAMANTDLAESLQIDILPREDEVILKINGNVLSGSEFLTLLKRYGRLQPDVEVLVSCDPDALHQDLVFVLSECARHGLSRLKMTRSTSAP